MSVLTVVENQSVSLSLSLIVWYDVLRAVGRQLFYLTLIERFMLYDLTYLLSPLCNNSNRFILIHIYLIISNMLNILNDV